MSHSELPFASLVNHSEIPWFRKKPMKRKSKQAKHVRRKRRNMQKKSRKRNRKKT